MSFPEFVPLDVQLANGWSFRRRLGIVGSVIMMVGTVATVWTPAEVVSQVIA